MKEDTALQSKTPPKAMKSKAAPQEELPEPEAEAEPPEADAVTAVAAQSPIKTLRSLLERADVRRQIATALPKHLTAERMIRVALTSVQRNPALLECSQMSILGSIVEASELGLEPNGVMGHAYLVPFYNGKTKKKEAQLMVGYKGLIDLARRSGKVTTITAEVVYEADRFEVVKGLHPDLIHVPSDLEDRGPLIGAYATARIKGEETPQFTYLRKSEIVALKERSKAKGGPWETDEAWMWKKSALRQLCKLLPCSIEQSDRFNPAEAIERDELRDKSIMQGDDFVDVHAEPVTGLDQLADTLEPDGQSDSPAGGK